MFVLHSVMLKLDAFASCAECIILVIVDLIAAHDASRVASVIRLQQLHCLAFFVRANLGLCGIVQQANKSLNRTGNDTDVFLTTLRPAG